MAWENYGFEGNNKFVRLFVENNIQTDFRPTPISTGQIVTHASPAGTVIVPVLPLQPGTSNQESSSKTVSIDSDEELPESSNQVFWS